jgi:hypothetical protein
VPRAPLLESIAFVLALAALSSAKRRNGRWRCGSPLPGKAILLGALHSVVAISVIARMLFTFATLILPLAGSSRVFVARSD